MRWLPGMKTTKRCFASRQAPRKFGRGYSGQFCSLSGWWLTVQRNLPIFCRQRCRSPAVTLRSLDNMDKAIEDQDTECNSRKEYVCSCWSAYILSDPRSHIASTVWYQKITKPHRTMTPADKRTFRSNFGNSDGFNVPLRAH